MSPPTEQRIPSTEHRSGPPLSCFWLRGGVAGDRFMLVGELDLVTADRAREAIGHAQAETTALTCDLGDVWFVDFSGMLALLGLQGSLVIR